MKDIKKTVRVKLLVTKSESC